MSKKTEQGKMQSRIDNTRDAKNANNGFKMGISSGTHGAGDALQHK